MLMEGISATDCFIVIECYDEIIVHNIWFVIVDASSIQLLNLFVAFSASVTKMLSVISEGPYCEGS